MLTSWINFLRELVIENGFTILVGATILVCAVVILDTISDKKYHNINPNQKDDSI